MPPINICLLGASGRMGQKLLHLILSDACQWRLHAGLVSETSKNLNQDAAVLAGRPASGILISSDMSLIKGADVVVDFSTPSATLAAVTRCVEYKVPMVVGTTGLKEKERQTLEAAAQTIPMVVASNTSMGITLLKAMLKKMSPLLADWDVGISDIHHKHKKDSPSGTALLLQDALTAPNHLKCACSSLRVGEVAGEHSVIFDHADEQLIFTHKALDRTLFARGALKAARWLTSRADTSPGLFSMEDVLGL